MSRRSRILVYVAAGAFLALTLVVLVTHVTVCRDYAYVCEHTGSRKGHRQWRTGPEANPYYRPSALELVMNEHYPGEATHRWTNYAVTGKTLFGAAVSYDHEQPGPAAKLTLAVIDRWVKRHSPEEARQLYRVLASGDRDAIQARVDAVLDEVGEKK